MGILAFVLAAVLIVVDLLIYLPFCKAYDAVLVEKEAQKAEVIATEEGASADVREEVPVAASQVIAMQIKKSMCWYFVLAQGQVRC